MHYAWIITLTGILVFILSQGFGKMSYSVILPSMKDGLSLTCTQVGLIGTGNFIGYLVLATVGGFLASRFGARRVIFLSLLVMGVGLGLSLSGLILPYCIGCYGTNGWRYAWYLMGIVVLVCSFVCYALLRDHPWEKGLTMYGGQEEQPRAAVAVTLFSAFQRVVGEKEIWKLACVYFMFGLS